MPDVCASFTKAAIDPLVESLVHAAKECGIKNVALAGGVAANSYLRATTEQACQKEGLRLFAPSPILCTDNAAMIAALGYYNYVAGKGISDLSLNASSTGEGFF